MNLHFVTQNSGWLAIFKVYIIYSQELDGQITFLAIEIAWCINIIV